MVALSDTRSVSSCASADSWLASTTAAVQALAAQRQSEPDPAPGSCGHGHVSISAAVDTAEQQQWPEGPADACAPSSLQVQPGTAAATLLCERRAAAQPSSLQVERSLAGSDALQAPLQNSRERRAGRSASSQLDPLRQKASTDSLTAQAAALQPFQMRRSRLQYERDVATCQEELRAGNSYELCLTTAFERSAPPAATPLDLYRSLRRINPAPHAAFLQFAGACPVSVGALDWSCCCQKRQGATARVSACWEDICSCHQSSTAIISLSAHTLAASQHVAM